MAVPGYSGGVSSVGAERGECGSAEHVPWRSQAEVGVWETTTFQRWLWANGGL